MRSDLNFNESGNVVMMDSTLFCTWNPKSGSGGYFGFNVKTNGLSINIKPGLKRSSNRRVRLSPATSRNEMPGLFGDSATRMVSCERKLGLCSIWKRE